MTGIANFTLDAFSLAGKRAMVTGGNTGLGRAFTVALARAGADVMVTSLAQDDGTTEALVTGSGRRYLFHEADISRPGAPGESVARCVEDLGGIDILVNSAGICLTAKVGDFDRSRWDRMIAVNLTAAFELAQHASREMVAQGSGKVINVASLFAYLGGGSHRRTQPARPASSASPEPSATSLPSTTCRSTRSHRGTLRPPSPQ